MVVFGRFISRSQVLPKSTRTHTPSQGMDKDACGYGRQTLLVGLCVFFSLTLSRLFALSVVKGFRCEISGSKMKNELVCTSAIYYCCLLLIFERKI